MLTFDSITVNINLSSEEKKKKDVGPRKSDKLSSAYLIYSFEKKDLKFSEIFIFSSISGV